MLEQLAVHIPRALVPPLAIMVALLVQQAEQVADVAGRIRLLLLEQRVDRVLQRVAVKHAEVFGEETPHHLHREALNLVDRRRATVGQGVVQGRNVGRRLGREFTAVLREHRLGRLGLQKEQGVVTVGQLLEREPRARLVREAPRLPDLELAEITGDDEARCRDVRGRIRRLLPVANSLILGLLQRHRRRLHLDDEVRRPEEIHEPRGCCEVLELGAHLAAVGAVAGEQLVQEGLGFGLFAARISRPFGHKFGKGCLNLETAAHGQMSRTESPA